MTSSAAKKGCGFSQQLPSPRREQFPKAAESGAESGNSGRDGKGVCSLAHNRADSTDVAVIRAAICRR